MKKIKYFILIVLALMLCSSVFMACSNKLDTDHSSLLRAGNIYRITYAGDGGVFQNAFEARFYTDKYNIKIVDPKDKNFQPTKSEHFIRRWYYKDFGDGKTDGETFTKVYWDFEKDIVTLDMFKKTPIVDKATSITFYDFVIYPEWEYNVYIDYYATFVDLDQTTVLGTLKGVDGKDLSLGVDVMMQDELPTYLGKAVTSASYTAVPEEYDPVKHAGIKQASDIMPYFYADADLTKQITFPLDSHLAPIPEAGKNRISIYVKFFEKKFAIISSPNDFTSIYDTNFYLWRDVDFSDEDGRRKTISAAEIFEDRVFLGNGKVMSGMSIVCNQSSITSIYMGLFGEMRNSSIKDLTIADSAFYYNMSIEAKSIHCGLLAGRIAGDKSEIVNVNFVNCGGFIRSNVVNKIYNVKYNELGGFAYGIKDADVPNVNILVTDESFIKYSTFYVDTPDEEADSGYTYRNNFNPSVGELLLQIGNLNQSLKSRAAKSLWGGGESTYYVTVRVWLTCVDDVYISLFGQENVDVGELDYVHTADGWYYCLFNIPEQYKASKITVAWDEEISDEYGVVIIGGSGNLTNSSSLGAANADKPPFSYDTYTQTLTYGTQSSTATTGIHYYEKPAGENDSITNRPEGYSIPVRLRIFARIADQDYVTADTTDVNFEDIKITIAGKEYSISDKELAVRTIGGASLTHYIEFWQPISESEPNAEVIVSFYGGRYELRFGIVASDRVVFNPKKVAA